METTNSSPNQITDPHVLKALQLMHSGVKPLEVMEQLKLQGLSDEEAKVVVRTALYEFRTKDMISTGKTYIDLLKVGVPVILVVTFVLSFFLTPFIGVPVGLIGGSIVMYRMVKNKLTK